MSYFCLWKTTIEKRSEFDHESAAAKNWNSVMYCLTTGNIRIINEERIILLNRWETVFQQVVLIP